MIFKKIDPVVLFCFLYSLLFILYEKYLPNIVFYFNFSYIPNTRTVQSTIIKYFPVLVLSFILYYLFKKIFNFKK